MNDVISKELLREVLGYKVEYVEECEHRDNIIGIWNNINSTPIKELNIYELAHKCKEWAYKKGYILMSTIRTNSSLAICEFSKSGKHDYEDELYNNFRAHTEHEAVFLACKWILENNTTRDNV